MKPFNIRRIFRRFFLGISRFFRAKKKKGAVTRKTSIFLKTVHIPSWLVILFTYLSICYVFIIKRGLFYKSILAFNIFLIIATFFVVNFVKRYFKVKKNDDSMTLVGLIIIIFSLITAIVSDIDFLSPLITPLAASSMIVNILLGPVAAIIVSLVSIFIFSILYNNDYSLFFIMFFSSITAILATVNVNHRRDITKSGLYVGLVNVIAIVIMFALSQQYYIKDLGYKCIWGIGNGIFSAILTIGVLPYLESLFSLPSNIRLLELADFTQPILKDMMLKAPGTYHHSLMVGIIAENAAVAIGANPLLVRVGAYYHDIGKIEKAEYFIENQSSNIMNVHDDLTPNLSSLILLAHVKEGVLMAKKAKLDKFILDIIEQHHGTNLIKHFYEKAIKENKDEYVEEEKYRYPGPKPKSKEAAIIMLADAVEAAARSLDEILHTQIKDIVDKVINNKFVDGQLDECEITLRDLHVISDSCIKTLMGVYHNRILNKEKDSGNKDL